jgi:hypothetical protein
MKEVVGTLNALELGSEAFDIVVGIVSSVAGGTYLHMLASFESSVFHAERMEKEYWEYVC